MDRQFQTQWPLILGLAALALIRPIISMVGLSEAIGQPVVSIAVTLLISLVWIAVVVRARVSRPVVTLTLTGLAYGVFAILISAVFTPILTGQLQGPATNVFALVSVLLTNALWGLIAGLIAQTVMSRG
ncbi:MAG: hypothetical protein ACOYEF_11420 [Planifilum sp.]|jgi:hypothetical protein